MASYHFSAQIIGRSPLRGGSSGKPRNVVAMAAYRAGVRLTDQASGRLADFSRRRGVVHTEILTPPAAAPWLKDRQALWNHVERIESRRDAQLAREINMALPHELGGDARVDLVRTFVAAQFVSRGMVADIAIHEPVAEKGDNPRNHHAHVMLTLRQATSTGLRRVKTREWNSDNLLLLWRRAWSIAQNQALELAGVRARVDERSLIVQREAALRAGDRAKALILARDPEIHVGPKARRLQARGRLVGSRVVSRPTARPSRGAFRSSGSREKRSRIIDYHRIDRGQGRAHYAADRVTRERRRLELHARRFEIRHARAQRMLALAKSRGSLWQQSRARSVLRELERLLAALLRPQMRTSTRQRELFSLSRMFDRGLLLSRQRSYWTEWRQGP